MQEKCCREDPKAWWSRSIKALTRRITTITRRVYADSDKDTPHPLEQKEQKCMHQKNDQAKVLKCKSGLFTGTKRTTTVVVVEALASLTRGKLCPFQGGLV